MEARLTFSVLLLVLLAGCTDAKERPPRIPAEPVVLLDAPGARHATEDQRRLYLKLPLAQPRFHWIFTEREKLLKGRLSVTLSSESRNVTLTVFEAGRIAEGWTAIDEDTVKDGEVYFGFRSNGTYAVSADDRVYVELSVPEAVAGIGNEMRGVLEAGSYRASSRFLIYHLEKSTGEPDVYAYVDNQGWSEKWHLRSTPGPGWGAKGAGDKSPGEDAGAR